MTWEVTDFKHHPNVVFLLAFRILDPGRHVQFTYMIRGLFAIERPD